MFDERRYRTIILGAITCPWVRGTLGRGDPPARAEQKTAALGGRALRDPSGNPQGSGHKTVLGRQACLKQPGPVTKKIEGAVCFESTASSYHKSHRKLLGNRKGPFLKLSTLFTQVFIFAVKSVICFPLRDYYWEFQYKSLPMSP